MVRLVTTLAGLSRAGAGTKALSALARAKAATETTSKTASETTSETSSETRSRSTKTTQTAKTASASNTVLASHDSEDLFLDWLDLLDDLSGWGDDFADLLDDGLGDGVLEHMGLVLGVGLLDGSLGAIVSLEHVQVGGGRSEEDVEWDLAGTDFHGGWGNGASGWDITELNLVSGLDGSVDNLASSAGGSATAEASGTTETATHTAVSSRASATAIAARGSTTITTSGNAGHQSGHNDELF